MRRWKKPFTGMCVLLCATTILLGQQRGGGGRGAAVPAAPGAAAQGNRGRPAPTNFPAQQRAIDTALAAKGNTLYGTHCRTCHGADLRGGENGGTNLLRSALVLNDQAGELIFPAVRDGRKNPGMSPMPPMNVPQDDVKAIAEYIHSIAATAQRQGGPPPGPPANLNIVVGDAAAGRAYFTTKCSGCHSATGDTTASEVALPIPVTCRISGLAVAAGAAATPLPSPQRSHFRTARNLMGSLSARTTSSSSLRWPTAQHRLSEEMEMSRRSKCAIPGPRIVICFRNTRTKISTT